MQFHIETMTCDGCARGVTKAIQAIDPSAVVQADPPSRKVEVTSSAQRAALAEALADAGFAPS
ncbi:copper chaperone [Rhodobacter sp. JA431]|nr:copper chaperone [Rhodobacter sp. JA431]